MTPLFLQGGREGFFKNDFKFWYNNSINPLHTVDIQCDMSVLNLKGTP